MSLQFVAASSEYLDLGDNTALGSGAHGTTCWAWMFQDSTATDPLIISRGRGGVSGYSCGMFNTDELNFSKHSVADVTSTAINLTTGTWLFVAIEEDASGVDYYKITREGAITTENVANTQGFDVTPTPSESLVAAVLNSGGTAVNFFDGRLASVGMSNVSLTQDEVLTRMRIMGGLSAVAFYPIIGNDDPEPDWSGNGFTGSHAGTPTKGNHPPIEMVENYL